MQTRQNRRAFEANFERNYKNWPAYYPGQWLSGVGYLSSLPHILEAVLVCGKGFKYQQQQNCGIANVNGVRRVIRFAASDDPNTMTRALALCCILFAASVRSSLPTLSFDYHNDRELQDYLYQVSAEHPNITRLYSIGQSVEKRDLWVLEISAANRSTLGIPNVKLIGNIHGNEPVGREVLLHLIQFLVSNYTTNGMVKWLVDNTRIHILPSLNPDGFAVSIPGTCNAQYKPGRSNKRGEDLNRNFPDSFVNNTRPVQPETLAVKEWLNTTQFVLSASLHGGALVANYPYDNTNESESGLNHEEALSPDNDVFIHLASVYATTHPTMHEGRPCPEARNGFANGIVNGAAWYPLIGGMQDYNYWKSGCMELTLEIGCCKYPIPDALPQLWQENQQALTAYISQAHRGVRGVIRDSITGVHISGARLLIDRRSICFHSNERGEYWRILLPGRYKLKVYKDGYVPLILPFIVADSGNPLQPTPTWLEVNMTQETQLGVSSQPSVDETTYADGQSSTSSAMLDQYSPTSTALNQSSTTDDQQAESVVANRSKALDEMNETLKLRASASKIYLDHLILTIAFYTSRHLL